MILRKKTLKMYPLNAILKKIIINDVMMGVVGEIRNHAEICEENFWKAATIKSRSSSWSYQETVQSRDLGLQGRARLTCEN